MDVLMPDMTGPELAARLRATHPTLRILFMSGHAEERLSERGVLLEGVHFVAKPFERAALLDKIEAVLASDHPGATGRGTMSA
jgi:FixJ family two-component response regulator